MMDPLPEGTRAIVDDAAGESTQTLFVVADVPLKRADELAAALKGPATRAVFEARIEQIIRHGHSPEQDQMLPIGMLPNEAQQMVQAGRDLLPKGDRQNLPVARRRFAKAAALLLAAIDRIDFELMMESGGQA